MEWEDWNEINEKPTVDVLFSNFFEVTDGLFRISILKFRQEVQEDICVKEDLYEEVPSFMNRINWSREGHIVKRWEATVTYEKQNKNIEERFPFWVCTDQQIVLYGLLFLFNDLLIMILKLQARYVLIVDSI